MAKYRCVAYFRVSTKDQLKRNSSLLQKSTSDYNEDVDIEDQHRVLKSFLACQPDFELVREDPFQEARSGSTLKKRQQLDACLKYLEDGKADTLLVVYFDRLGRNYNDLLKTVDFLNRKQIHLFEIKDIYNPKKLTSWDAPDKNSAMYMVQNTMQLIFMSYNSSAFIERVSKAATNHNSEMIKKGYYYFGGKVRYGYVFLKDTNSEKDIAKAREFGLERGDNKYHIVESEAEIIRYIYNEYLAGKGDATICYNLREKGCTYRGKQFKFSFIDDILRCEAYAYGTFVVRQEPNIFARKQINNEIFNRESELGRRLTRDEKLALAKPYLSKDDEINKPIPNVYPPIIDKEVFEKVQQIRKEKRPINQYKEPQYNNILTGILWCGTCGSKMHSCGARYIKRGRKKVWVGGYNCSSRHKGIKCDGPQHLSCKADDLVWETLKQDLLNGVIGNTIAHYWDIYVRSKSLDSDEDTKEQIKQLKEQNKKLVKQLASINDTINDLESIGSDEAKEYKEKKNELLERMKSIKEKIDFLSNSTKEKAELRESILQSCTYNEAMEENKRDVVLTFIEKVVYMHDDDTQERWLDIYYQFNGIPLNSNRVYIKLGNQSCGDPHTTKTRLSIPFL